MEFCSYYLHCFRKPNYVIVSPTYAPQLVTRRVSVAYPERKIILFILLLLLTFSALTLLVGRQEGHPARKQYRGDGGGWHWLVRMEWRPAGWSLCLPLLIFPCTIKSRSSLLAPAHPGGPRKRAVKWLWSVLVVTVVSKQAMGTCNPAYSCACPKPG